MPLLYDVISRTGAPQPMLVTSPSRTPTVVQAQLMDTIAPYLAWTQLLPQPQQINTNPQQGLPGLIQQPKATQARSVPIPNRAPAVSQIPKRAPVVPQVNQNPPPTNLGSAIVNALPPVNVNNIPDVPPYLVELYMNPNRYPWLTNPIPSYKRFQFPETPAPVVIPEPTLPSTDPGFSETELTPYLWEWVKYGLSNLWNYFSDPNRVMEYDSMEY